jgi:hypothetical protein
MTKRERCCDIIACRDNTACGCCLPTTTGDARRLKWVGVVLGITALIFLLIGLFVPSAIANAFERALFDSAILAPNNGAFELMKTNHQYPMKLDVYLYNILNPEEIIKGDKPSLEEVGPYVYWVYRDVLDDYKFSANDTLLDYQYYERYIFDEKLSISSDSDLIWQSNMPFWGAANALLEGKEGILHDSVQELVFPGAPWEKEVNQAFAHRSVRETLFGYDDDPFFAKINEKTSGIFPKEYTGIIQNYTNAQDARQRLPLNEQITTGGDGRENTRHYKKYRGLDYVPALSPNKKCPWSEDETVGVCQVRGIDGAATVPMTDSTKSDEELAFLFWYPSLSRSVQFVLDKKYVEEGIDLYRFRFSPNEWRTSAEYPYNEPFEIITGGVIPLKKALAGSPLSITSPRGLRIADKAFTAGYDVKYLDDNKRDPFDIHSMDTFFEMEKRTGSTLRFQSTSEMVVSIGAFTYEYDDWFVILNDDELYELNQLIGGEFKESVLEELKSNHHHNNNNNNNIFDDNLDTLQENQNNSFNIQPCGFSPFNHQHCAANPYFSKLSTLFEEQKTHYKQIKQSAQFDSQSTQPEQTEQTEQTEPDDTDLGDIVTITYLPKIASANIPFFWANQTGGLDQAGLHALGSTFKAVDNTVKVLPIICFLIAFILFLLGAFFMIRGSQYQTELNRVGALHQFRQDGDLDPNGYQLGGNSQHQNDDRYNDALDALDLDPIYSDGYTARSGGTAASSLHISQGKMQPYSQQGYNRSYSTASSHKRLNRDRSFEPLMPAKNTGYGGVELKKQ